MIALFALCLLVALLATAEDLWRRRVSNYLTLPALAAALAVRAFVGGWSELGDGFAGALIGFGVFLPFFLKGGMGGGDVKLMAAFGAIVGREHVVIAAILTAIFGGLLALGLLGARSIRRRLGASAGADAPGGRLFIPYAPALSLGAALSLLGEEEIWRALS